MPDTLRDLLPQAQSLDRVGVIDIGSNSVRLVVFDGKGRNPDYFYNEKIMCGLGAGLGTTGKLNPEGRKRAMNALARFQAMGEALGTGPLIAVATAAMRDAQDGLDFCQKVQERFGLPITVISGPQEAQLAAYGVLMGKPDYSGYVVDIGGASMEVAEVDHGTVRATMTSPLGPLKLADLSKDDRADFVKKHVKKLHKATSGTKQSLTLVGGSWRAIARIDMERRAYPLPVLHEYQLTPEAIQETCALIQESDLETVRKACGISEARMAIVPLACEVLSELVTRFEPSAITISAFGLREGVLYTQLDPNLREADPLITACRLAESKHARQPGFGEQLYHFITPLFSDAPPQMDRLIHAAALIHDVAWRTHPDFRAEACFDFVTRANMANLTHAERLFIALALTYRYRNKGTEFAAYDPLLPPQWRLPSEILGRALRFGSMFLLRQDHDDLPAHLKWSPKSKHLALSLDKGAEALFGEIAQKRFEALARILDAQKITRP